MQILTDLKDLRNVISAILVAQGLVVTLLTNAGVSTKTTSVVLAIAGLALLALTAVTDAVSTKN